METYRSRLTGVDYKINKIVNDHMVSLTGVDRKIKVCTDRGSLKLFYDRIPPALIPPIHEVMEAA